MGLIHIGVFILLLLSGERNFGVRLNKPYTATVPMDIPVFSGSHADLLVTVFHKIVATGHQRLTPLFDCLLTILVNVSPYLKTLSMVASIKLLHLLEAFSTPWFLYSAPGNHHLVFFLLEIFNNIIQYQFDGNSNLVYTIIRKRHVFHALANLPSDTSGIARCLNTRKGSRSGVDSRAIGQPSPKISATLNKESIAVSQPSRHSPTKDTNLVSSIREEDPDGEIKTDSLCELEDSMEGSRPAQPAEPGTLKATLLETPAIGIMTERELAHPGVPLGGDVPFDAAEGVLQKEPTDVDTKSPEDSPLRRSVTQRGSIRVTQANSFSVDSGSGHWVPSPEWVQSWRAKLPLQTIMRLLQVLVPQVEKICIDKGLTDESEILKFLQHGTLVGLLPVPHPILIRKYQANGRTTSWFRTYMWGVLYLRNVEPAMWYDTEVKLFEIQRV